jgi:hypothetical protein
MPRNQVTPNGVRGFESLLLRQNADQAGRNTCLITFFEGMIMKLDELIQVLHQVIEYYRLPDTDVCFSRYDSTEDAIIDMQSIVDSLENEDLSVLSKLALLFAPTGSVQEILIDSGWGNEYIEISSHAERLIAELKLQK